ncbi:MAG: tRNA adenosine(34) deaminase TadA [Candidatus Margulisbacteria bacterium]|jgi:tRNA(adenine34) deaminase|nr:tRNA adenosine(34) deaminase TadA [Candidatus Margulisiibacteriota bacterium]
MQNRNDEYFMREALKQARKALKNNEVPVGAVIVKNGRIIARGWNEREQKQDPCRHAELTAIRRAARALGSWRLLDCALYVTLEPCAMCAGAIVLARIPRVVYAAADPKTGACGSVLNVLSERKLNHRPEVVSGLLADEAGQMLKDFFKKARGKINRAKIKIF